jgi:uncharacterized protein YutE (UPF0331/DUF86 family)
VTTTSETRQILELIAPGLESEGYQVFLQPSRKLLPSFMEGFVPDAIALRPSDTAHAGKNLAIEIVGDRLGAKHEEQGLENRFANAADWELRVYYARSANDPTPLPTLSRQTIDEALASIHALMDSEQLQAGLLLAWATFEALGRAIIPEKFVRSQTPGRLLEVMAAEGLITPSEADELRSLSSARNQLIHGGLDRAVRRGELTTFLDILKTLRETLNSAS